MDSSNSHFAQSPTQRGDEPARDPMEAIYALNIGDFVAESFFSDELLSKITNRMADEPNKLQAQLEDDRPSRFFRGKARQAPINGLGDRQQGERRAAS